MPIYVVTETREVLIEAEVKAANAEAAVSAYRKAKSHTDSNVSAFKVVADNQTVAEVKEEEI